MTNSNFQWQNIRFGMAKEIAAHTTFLKEFIHTKNERRAITIKFKDWIIMGRPVQGNVKKIWHILYNRLKYN